MLNIIDGTFLTNVGSGSFSVGSTSTGVSEKPILNAKVKKNGVWQDLIGSDIDDVNLGGGSSTKSISYLKWEITKTKGNPPANGCLQIAEFYLYQGDTLYSWNANVSITTDMQGVSNEGVDKLIDGNRGSKYNTQNWGSTQTNDCNIVISLGETITIDNKSLYYYVTANDEPSRDPISWKLYGSTDGTNWELLDTRNDISITDIRGSLTQGFFMIK